MTAGSEPKPPMAASFIAAKIIGGLRHGHDQFVLRHTILLDAFQTTDTDHLLAMLGPGWEAREDLDMAETTLRRRIPAERALRRLGF